MPARSVVLTCSVIFAVLALLSWRSFTQAQITNPQPAPPAGELQAGELQSVTLVFGTLDAQPVKWDGAASLSTGEIVKIEGYHFSEADNVSGNSWQSQEINGLCVSLENGGAKKARTQGA